MLKTLRTQPIYLLLLPVFFVLHGYLENIGFISAKDAGVLCLSYIALTLGIAFFSWIFFRNKTKAALITTVWMSFFFFFGALHEFLKEHVSIRFFSKYSFLLTVFFIALVIVFIYLKKIRKPFLRSTLFLNLLFIVYIIIDAGWVSVKMIKPEHQKLSVYGFARQNKYTICDTCKKPDIYFMLMDEYTSSLSLKEQFNFDNDLDSFLLQKGFSIQAHSRSNYNFTAFSMSSTLNMSFIKGIPNVKTVTAEDYANCILLIRDNEVIKFLDAHGYEIHNYSVFDLAGHPAMVNQSFLPLKTKLITDRTLFTRLNKDIGWLLMTWYPFKLFTRNHFLVHRSNNEQFIELVKQSAAEKKSRPRFFYAHFYMPHPPFYYDKNGNAKENETIIHEYNNMPVKAYLEYLIYTNTKIREMISSIQQQNPSAVILLTSDHGLRNNTTDPYPIHFFRNLNAVYYPDKDYRLLYDSITNVNQFRVVFNKLFSQQYPLLKDSSIYLRDKQ